MGTEGEMVVAVVSRLFFCVFNYCIHAFLNCKVRCVPGLVIMATLAPATASVHSLLTKPT